MIKIEDVIFDPTDPRAVALEGKEVLVSDYYDMRDAKKCVYEKYEKTELPFFCDGEYFTFIAQIPSPTYRSYNALELNNLVGTILVSKSTGNRMMVCKRIVKGEEYILSFGSGNNMNAEALLDKMEHLDGSPCGIKE